MPRFLFAVPLTLAALAAGPAFAAAQADPAKAAVSTLNDVCFPLLKGGDVAKVASAAGFRTTHGAWEMKAGSTDVVLEPPDTANPHVCSATMTFAPGAGPAVADAVGAWAKAQTPPLAPDKVKESSGSTVVSTWAAQTPAGQEGVSLDQPTAGGRASLWTSLTPPAAPAAPSSGSR